MRAWLVPFAALVLAPATSAGQVAPRLGLPVDCDIGADCHVQYYVDQAAGPAAQDYTCGGLAYDSHSGTDIRVPSMVEMRSGVPVVAAAAGVVEATRDGMPDVPVDELDPSLIEGREAGNGVVIDHGGGWVTQYSHLRRDSVTVAEGDRVAAGQRLGLIGLSGNTEYPHVEFTVRFRGDDVDPFTGRPPESGCGDGGPTLWTDAARRALAYRPGGLLKAGFATEALEPDDVLDGTTGAAPRSTAIPALVFWAFSYGLRAGDRGRLVLTGPNGDVVTEVDRRLPGDKAHWVAYGGARHPSGDWPAGTYTGRYRVTRSKQDDGTRVIVEVERTLTLR